MHTQVLSKIKMLLSLQHVRITANYISPIGSGLWFCSLSPKQFTASQSLQNNSENVSQGLGIAHLHHLSRSHYCSLVQYAFKHS